MLTVSCSKLAQAMACPPSQSTQHDEIISLQRGKVAVIPYIPMAHGDEADAKLGTAVHNAILREIDGEIIDIAQVAEEFKVDSVELERLVTRGRFLLDRAGLRDPMVEHFLQWTDEVAGVRLTGHPDILDTDEPGTNRLRNFDFKSGWLESDWEPQLRGYAFLTLKNYSLETSVYSAIFRLRGRDDGIGYLWTREELDSWWANDVLPKLSDPRFKTGPHCAYCPRGPTCPAKTARLQQAAEVLKLGFAALPADPTAAGDKLADLIDGIKQLRPILDNAYEMAKAEVLARGGLPTSDGRQIVVEAETHKPIIFDASWKLVAGAVPDNKLNDVFSVSKEAVEAIVKSRAAQGRKTHVWKMFLQQLEDAGALGKKTVEKLKIKIGAKHVASTNQVGGDHPRIGSQEGGGPPGGGSGQDPVAPVAGDP